MAWLQVNYIKSLNLITVLMSFLKPNTKCLCGPLSLVQGGALSVSGWRSVSGQGGALSVSGWRSSVWFRVEVCLVQGGAPVMSMCSLL